MVGTRAFNVGHAARTPCEPGDAEEAGHHCHMAQDCCAGEWNNTCYWSSLRVHAQAAIKTSQNVLGRFAQDEGGGQETREQQQQ
mmetsp:Transcript_30735/g.69882  ORF Transcript_30735/g.69882 Transcript_30735/m.69882 type:complete len:84 (-) Transcript_30735:299-550(-)